MSTDESNQSFFKSPNAIESFLQGDSIRLIVTDTSLFHLRISLLDGESGKALYTRDANGNMQSVAVDHFLNIYICFWPAKSVSMLTSDLSEERIILATEGKRTTYRDALAYDLEEYPSKLASDPQSDSLLVTSWYNERLLNHIQIYELEFE